MLVETNNLVSEEDFRRELSKYVAAAQQGCGPIAVTRDTEVVGFFVSAAEYEAMFGTAVKELLTAREKGPTVSHEEVRTRAREAVRRRSSGAKVNQMHPDSQTQENLAAAPPSP